MAIPIEVHDEPQPLRVLLALLKFGLLTGLGVGVLLTLMALPFKVKGVYDYHFGFSQQRWLAASPLHGTQTGYLDNPRATMVADVMAHHLQPGMTRTQVLALLGPANNFGSAGSPPVALISGHKLSGDLDIWCRLRSQTEPILRYGVSWGSWDPVFLTVNFDRNNRMVAFHLIED